MEYTNQFPSPLTSMIAKFVAFVAGSFAAVLLGVALMDETLLEAHVSATWPHTHPNIQNPQWWI